MSEIELQRESEGRRNTGGADSTKDYIRADPKDMGLIMSVPHSIQPVVLEDNQATIRILESGKSPAFRHADKTQGINLGWLSCNVAVFELFSCDLTKQGLRATAHLHDESFDSHIKGPRRCRGGNGRR